MNHYSSATRISVLPVCLSLVILDQYFYIICQCFGGFFRRFRASFGMISLWIYGVMNGGFGFVFRFGNWNVGFDFELMRVVEGIFRWRFWGVPSVFLMICFLLGR